MRHLGDEIKDIDNQLNEVDNKIRDILIRIPNLINEDVPQGASDEETLKLKMGYAVILNLNLKRIGIVEELKMADFERR